MIGRTHIAFPLIGCAVLLCSTVPGRAAADTLAGKSARSVAADSPKIERDALATLLDDEARLALGKGEFRRAWTFLHRVVVIEPDNLVAWRELGRTCAALGELSEAVRILGMVDRESDHAPDPELHFIRGEALIALGRRASGLRELATAETQLPTKQPSYQVQMWRARIYALRGDVDAAVRLYRQIYLHPRTTDDQQQSILVNIADTYVVSRDWRMAKITLRAILRRWPDHERAHEMLGWALESTGALDREIEVRSELAARLSTRPALHAAAYARALERSFSFEPALEEYRRARSLGLDVAPAIARLEGQLAPEIAANGHVRNDPLGNSYGGQAGVSLPVVRRLRFTMTATFDEIVASETAVNGNERERLLVAYAMPEIQFGKGNRFAAGVGGWDSDVRGSQVSGRAVLRTSPRNDWRLFGRGEVNAPWRDSTATMRYGGSVDGLELQLYRSLFDHRVVAMIGGRVRRMSLAMADFGRGPAATQYFGVAGVDLVVISSSASTRGQLLDNEMLVDDRVASGLRLGFRHYETRSNDPFGQRLTLVEQSQIEELSFVAGHALDDRGILGLQALSGLGYDSARDAWLWRGSIRMDVSLTPSSRLSSTVEAFRETTTGVVGRALLAQIGFHVDI